MSNDNFTIDNRLAPDPRHPAYHFDLAPVLGRSRALQHNPDRIQHMCEQCVRRLAPGALTLFRDSGFFLVIPPGTDATAENLVHTVNVALIELFFGTESFSEIPTLFRIAEHKEIVDAGAPDMVPTPSMPARRPIQRPSQTDTVDPDPIARLAGNGVPGYDGLRTGFLPMINLRRDAASIFLCGPVGRRGGRTVFGSAALAGTDPQDRAAIDQAILDYAVGFARRIVPTKFAAAIAPSVSYETLAWSRGRRIYQEALRAANIAENPFLLVKIEDVPAGTTVARLAEIVATVRPFVKRVFLELPDCETGLTFSGQIGATGLIASLSQNAAPAEAVRVAARLVRTAAAQQALSCINGVDGPETLAHLRAVGIRFASGRVYSDGNVLESPVLGGDREPRIAA